MGPWVRSPGWRVCRGRFLVGHKGKTAGRDQPNLLRSPEEEFGGLAASKAEMEAEIIDVKVDMLFHHLW